MQTFLPLDSFKLSAHVLDDSRLGKQRIESKQILNALADPTDGWRRHPAVKMWKGYEHALRLYYNWCLFEWEARGYRNIALKREPVADEMRYPWWFHDEKYHSAWRAVLLAKDYEFYSRYGWIEEPKLKMVWPT